MSKQSQAKDLIRQLLAGRGIEADFGIVMIAEQPWEVFQYETVCIALDESSGVWVGPYGGEWKCVSLSCDVESAIEGVEALLGGKTEEDIGTLRRI
jgi:hypothetical protein